jgi:hypothetical protein
MAVGVTAKRSDDNGKAAGIEAFSKRITGTVSDVSADVLPIVGAVGKEVFLEAKSDVPKVAEEISTQVTHFSSLRESHQNSR